MIAVATGSMLLAGAVAAAPLAQPAVGDATLSDASAVSDDGGAASLAEAGAVGRDETVASLAQTTVAIRELVAGRVAPEVDPASLFDIPLGDERTVQLEAARLALFLRQPDAGSVDAKKRAAQQAAATARRADGGAAAQLSPEAFRAAEPALWAARRELDQARLSFYELPAAQRTALLAQHGTPRDQARAGGAESDAERRQHEAEAEQKKALEAAGRARSEAERVVAEEEARLLGVEQAQSTYAAELRRRDQEMIKRREAAIGWAQRAREATSAPGTEAVDRTYDDLRRTLREARTDLSQTLKTLSEDVSKVPRAGADPLAELHVDVDTSRVREERARVDGEAQRLGAQEAQLLESRAAQLFDEIDQLNGERLALLEILTPDKRDAITGFGTAGLDQAASEVRQLTLIARYHRYAIGAWLSRVRAPGRSIVGIFGSSVLVFLGWLIAFAAFVWWRRRAGRILAAYHQRLQRQDREERLVLPSGMTRALGFLIQVRSPLEWLVLLSALGWLLPVATQSVLEVQILSVTLRWIFAGALIVDSINALAGGQPSAVARREIDTARLRLRSLRLVGRVVVVFGLILVISSRLVGKGTIHEWVFSTCWLASLPIFLLLIRWWRDVVFQRVEAARKKSAFEQWVLRNQKGWKSFLAATAGGVFLFVTGAQRAFRGWVSRFNVTRRVLAYLFRRKLDKLGAEGTTVATAPLAAAAFDALGPETPSATWIDGDVDEALAALAARIRDRRGGVIAIVGERGIGKSTLIARLRSLTRGVVVAQAPGVDADALRRAIGRALGLAESASVEEVAAALDASTEHHAMVIDDAHRITPPVMGGLAALDALLRTASRHSARTTWILTFDEVLWQFLERARGACPLFDEVLRLRAWSEENVVQLVKARTAQAGLSPSFEHVMEALPANADEVDRMEALQASAARYYRLLWDNASGNPGVVLHMWRRSLGQDDGGAVFVRVAEHLDTQDFEALPDSAVFVLRAVLQLAPARRDQITRATMLSPSAVDDALRYAIGRGYLESVDGSYRVTWTWFRAMTRFLQRRHLLPAW